MIRFFRKLRIELIKKNQVRRYFLYAIGEVFLVVVGILIALQIDTWNEARKDRRTEQEIIGNLRQEFLANQTELDSTLVVVAKNRDANLKLMEFFGKPAEALQRVNLDSIVFFSVEYQRFIPSQNALTDLIQSGGLQLITNQDLKDALYDWTRVMGLIDETYSGVKQKTEDDIIPFLTPRYPLKDIDRFGGLGWKEPSRLPTNKYALFSEIAYESLVDDYLYRLLRYENNLKKGRSLIQKILRIIENNP
ncbi:MAG: DUF6090 family protein [Robiginitalea sp.]|nr:DUF6090 family protein [Robiginitalea sp.]